MSAVARQTGAPRGRWVIALLPTLGCLGPSEADKLAVASEDIIFDSMDKLGPHHSLARLRQTVERPGFDAQVSEDAVEIWWQDWDHFEHRRVADGRLASGVRVMDGAPYVSRPGADELWEQRADADPYRMELRAAWNLWDQALGPFEGRILYEDQGAEVIEGRPVRRYTLSLAPLPEPEAPPPAAKAKRKAKAKAKVEPAAPVDPLRALSGELWLDTASAVRLVAEVEASRLQGDRQVQASFQLAVSAIGADQGLKLPINIKPLSAPIAPTPVGADPEAAPPARPRSPRKQ
jgi:hypothetical protein